MFGLEPSPPANLSPDPLFNSHSTTITSSPLPTPPPSKAPAPSTDAAAMMKRQRNTVAARRYRQKRIDRISELEGTVDQLTRERDELRLKLARQEAETAALREVLRMKPGS